MATSKRERKDITHEKKFRDLERDLHVSDVIQKYSVQSNLDQSFKS